MPRTMIIDDDVEFLAWLRAELSETRDFQVVAEAMDGKEAIQLIKTWQPDIIISDVYLPLMDGFDLARWIKKNNLKSTKLILISAHDDRVYSRLAEEEGALRFIPKKNISLKALREVLQMEV